MVFAVNCGADGAPNSFTNFKNAALAIGDQLKAAASSASSAAPYATAPPDGYTTAAYGGVTIPAAPSETVVTVTVSVEASQWTTVYSSYPGSPAATPASLTGNVHKVLVGNNGSLSYDPPFVMAQPRDIIQFELYVYRLLVCAVSVLTYRSLRLATRRTTLRRSRPSPRPACRSSPLTAPRASTPACKSPWLPPARTRYSLSPLSMPVADNATTFPTWSVTVNDTNPLWFYCKQHKPDGSSHCGAGMVFAVNPVQSSARNFSAFQTLAQTLNGTANGSAPAPSGSGSGAAPSQTGAGNGATGAATNLALGLGGVLAVVAALL